jgi:proteasome lid subunit RPN8/RPN11
LTLILPGALRAQIEREAKAVFPGECCGLIEGLRTADTFEAERLHPARNLAQALGRFEIAPEDHFAALKAARGRGRRLIGCYHSHPGGAAKPSPDDAKGAGEQGFVWVIAATQGAAFELAAFVYRGPCFEPLRLAIGADCVTSSLKVRR